MTETSSAERLEPCQTGVGLYCAPGPAEGQQPRWLLWFDDADRTTAVYDDEATARRAFAGAEARGWNCYLFEPARRAPGVPEVWRDAVEQIEVDLAHRYPAVSVALKRVRKLLAAPASPKQEPVRVIGAPGKPYPPPRYQD